MAAIDTTDGSVTLGTTSTLGTTRWRRGLLAVVASLLLVMAGCSSDDSSSDADSTADAGASDTTTDPESATDPTQPADDTGQEPLVILVSNDDGYSAPGIDALVEGLLAIEGFEVTVVAPADERSGTGGNSTEGPLEVTEVELASGHPAQAVDGFPADAVRVALDDLEVEPHLVITGINAGQNLGPIIDISGTVGAARAAVARGVPALATSQGWAGSTDAELEYRVAVSIIIDWVLDNRDALLAGEVPAEVVSLNVPSCGTDPIRGLAEVAVHLEAVPAEALELEVDCTSTVSISDLPAEDSTDAPYDVGAFNNGYATLGPVPDEPVPAEDVTADEG